MTAPTRLALAVALTTVLLAGVAAANSRPAATRADIPAACGSVTPYFAVARYPLVPLASLTAAEADGPAIVAFRERSPDDPADQVTLATLKQVGSVSGLAYDPAADTLYAAAYHKRGVPFGPGGPGAIYRIEVATGAVSVLARLAAGPDTHDPGRAEDARAAAGVGQLGLGGLALSDDGSALFVTNLADGRIYRLATANGAVEASFPHGASKEAWARSARPFALGWHEGALFQGIVKADDPPGARVFRSAADGSGATEVLTLDLAYGRRPPWFAWETFGGPAGNGQPMLTDLAFRPGGDLVLGLRDRRVDMTLFGDGATAVPGGDLVPAWYNGARWQAAVQPELYDDDLPGVDEVTWGGLAMIPGLDTVVATAADAAQVPGGRALLGGQALVFDNLTGERRAAERLYRHPAGGRDASYVHGLGDLAVLCDAAHPPPGVGATATAAEATAARTATLIAAQTVSPTLTAEATVRPATETAEAATATAGAPATATAFADGHRRIVESCGTDNPMFFMAVHGRDLEAANIADLPAIQAFDDTPADDLSQHITLATQRQVGTIYGLAYDLARQQAYAGAFHKRGTFFGPSGPGGIYQLDLSNGTVRPWVTVPAGPDYHQLRTNFDAPGADWAGKVSLGDLDLSEDGRTLFAMNLWDRRIWRFSVPDGAPLGPIPTGGAATSWAEDARPFALGVHDGWLYHGVVDSAERGAPGSQPTGYVYRSRPDGSEMAEVASFPLAYPRPNGLLWGPWSAQPTHQAILSDIEFRPDGDLVLGLRDRLGDTQVLTIAQGDLLPTMRDDDRWDVVTDPEYYGDQLAHDETTWGALAAFPGRDWVVSSALAPVTINSGGALWYDNATGGIQREESLYVTFRGQTMLPTFAKSQGLGDLEALCPAGAIATPTPGPTLTPTATLTPSPSATATTTSTPTATPRPKPIYLPVLLGEACEDRVQHADIVVVIDVSTSMGRTTSAGRTKLAAAQAAVTKFIARMALTPGRFGQDQVAVVGFNNRWWVAQSLTSDAEALGAAVAGLPASMAEGTRLDLAVEGGLAALAAPGRNPANTPVMVLLTDGLPNRVPTPAPAGSQEDTVLAVAGRAKAAGVRLYTVGLGQATDIDATLLRAMATSPDLFFDTPDAETLGEIYAQIAYTIGCPGGRHDWGRPWP